MKKVLAKSSLRIPIFVSTINKYGGVKHKMIFYSFAIFSSIGFKLVLVAYYDYCFM